MSVVVNTLDEIIHGEALAVLRTLSENSVDAIVCDPPAGIGFMGKEWDKDKGERDIWIAWLAEVMHEALRVLKPGGHAFVWALPRTSHWTAMALEDAGFEIRDCIIHLFGTGFPKSRNISKDIDKMAGAKRKVIGTKPKMGGVVHKPNGTGWDRPWQSEPNILEKKLEITAPATPEAEEWDGWGTTLKPGSEHWWLCRKPLSEPTIARNVLKWGTGGLNIDTCRIKGQSWGKRPPRTSNSIYGDGKGINLTESGANTQGRWPANVVMSHSIFCLDDTCSDDCPVKMLGEQSGYSGKLNTKAVFNHGDEGTASRYFHTFWPDPFLYCAKPSSAERNRGCEELPKGPPPASARSNPALGRQSALGLPRANSHPTVKSIQLMRHLIRLITPPSGTILDCFAGSGSTLVAAIHENRHFIGIEMNDTEDEPYVRIARARITQAYRERG